MLSTRQSFFKDVLNKDTFTPYWFFGPEPSTTIPLYYEKQKDILSIYLDVPGIKKDDLIVEAVEDNRIKVIGEKKIGPNKGKVEEIFTVHEKYDLKNIEAILEDGVLHLKIKEKESIKPKQIPIKVLTT